jgi:NADH-quinone oxidoreductase subunit J
VPDLPPTSLLVFGALAAVAALSAIGVVVFANAVRSALCLVLNFFTLSFLYFTLNAELLGIIQIVVYTGAIMVLFLFVIMLLNLGAVSGLSEPPDLLKKAVGLVLGFALMGMVATQVIQPLIAVDMPQAPIGYGAPQPIGRALFTTYVWPFEIVSVLLLIGVVGAILLAKRRL